MKTREEETFPALKGLAVRPPAVGAQDPGQRCRSLCPNAPGCSRILTRPKLSVLRDWGARILDVH